MSNIERMVVSRSLLFVGLVVLIGTFSILILFAGGGEGETFSVDAEGEGDFTRIQQAIDNASAGDIINIGIGVYRENVTIDRELRIFGIHPSQTTIAGWVSISDVEGGGIRDLTITKSLTIEDSVKFKVQDCQLPSITITSSSDSRITGNRGIENEAGEIESGLEITLTDRHHLGETTGNQIMDNECAYIGLIYADGNYIVNNSCSDSIWVGIYLDHAAHNEIARNRCENNAVYGIYMDYYSRYNRLVQNDCIGNLGTGIYLYYCWYNEILENDCARNGGDGIHLDVATANLVAFNICRDNGRYGINVLYYRNDDRDEHGNILLRNSMWNNRKGFNEDVENSLWRDYTSFECMMCYILTIGTLIPVGLILRLQYRRDQTVKKKNGGIE